MSMQAGLTWGPSLQLKRPIVSFHPQELEGQSPISRLAEEGNPGILPISNVCCDVIGEDAGDGEDQV